MKLISLKFLLISLVPSVVFAEFDNDRSDQYQTIIIDKQAIPETEKQYHLKGDVPSQNNASNRSEYSPENEPKTSSIERLVQPLTRWAEDQLHDTPLVRTPNQKSPKPKNQNLNLRDAIRIARKENPGMVLGAEAIPENGRLRFEIRIISESGVIKTVSISSLIDGGHSGADDGQDSNKQFDRTEASHLKEGRP